MGPSVMVHTLLLRINSRFSCSSCGHACCIFGFGHSSPQIGCGATKPSRLPILLFSFLSPVCVFDFNRSYQIAKESVGGGDLIVLPGSEITRNMPPGHFNAIFIKDANKLLFENDSVAGIYEANKQGAFVFWNHPHWTSNSQGRMDGIAKLDPVHKNLIKENLIHGIEVANELTFSEEAFEIALENNLTILGTSDIHGISDWLFEIPEGGHRPLTYILSNDLKQNSIRFWKWKKR